MCSVIGRGQCYVAVSAEDNRYILKFVPRKMIRTGEMSHFLNPLHWRSIYRRRIRQAERLQAAEAGLLHFKEACARNPSLASSIFLETKIIENKTILYRDEGRKQRFQGTVLQQEKSVFLDNSTDLDSFDWNEIVQLHTGMWRLGVGLYAFSEFWGPRNWCFGADKRMRVGDFSHLTAQPSLILKVFSKSMIETKTQLLLKRHPPEKESLVKGYMNFLTSRLTPAVFAEHWQAPAPS